MSEWRDERVTGPPRAATLSTVPTTPATCPLCAEAIAPDARKCPWCGATIPRPATLRWDGDAVTVLAQGDMPDAACFGCGAPGPPRLRRLQGPRDAALGHVDVPTCAACARRAEVVPMLFVAILGTVGVAGLCFVPTLLSLRAEALLVGATVAFCLLVVVGLALATHHNARTRVRVTWRDHEATLRLPDGRAVRRAIERDGT